MQCVRACLSVLVSLAPHPNVTKKHCNKQTRWCWALRHYARQWRIWPRSGRMLLLLHTWMVLISLAIDRKKTYGTRMKKMEPHSERDGEWERDREKTISQLGLKYVTPILFDERAVVARIHTFTHMHMDWQQTPHIWGRVRDESISRPGRILPDCARSTTTAAAAASEKMCGKKYKYTIIIWSLSSLFSAAAAAAAVNVVGAVIVAVAAAAALLLRPMATPLEDYFLPLFLSFSTYGFCCSWRKKSINWTYVTLYSIYIVYKRSIIVYRLRFFL